MREPVTIPEHGSREAQGWGSEGDTGEGASFSDSIQVRIEHEQLNHVLFAATIQGS